MPQIFLKTKEKHEHEREREQEREREREREQCKTLMQPELTWNGARLHCKRLVVLPFAGDGAVTSTGLCIRQQI